MPLRHAHPTNRRVPPVLRPDHVERIQSLLGQDEYWVQRLKWRRWLEEGDDRLTVPISGMGRGERVAAAAWVRQQRHYLHRTIVDPSAVRAPEGWLDQLPLMRILDA